MSAERVVVYAGKGSSHSWAWTADLFESEGVFETQFVDAKGLVECIDDGVSLVVVSGGDGFEIARALSPRGFEAIAAHVHQGGRYFGACAGAYLPLPSKIEPLDGFNLSSTKIRNIVSSRDESAESSPRTGVGYGSCSILHLIRGDVVLGDWSQKFTAPLYGGPVFREPETDQVVLRYSSFTEKTKFQADRARAEAVMLGAPAMISVAVGYGSMLLSGPHLEHPGYPEANSAFMRLVRIPRGGKRTVGGRPGSASRPVDSSLADLKVAVLGMERESFLVGAKLWDGGRMLELAEAIEKRKSSMDGDTAQAVSSLLDDAREDLLSLGPEGVAESDSAPGKLVEAARLCVNRHFKILKG